MVCRAESQKLCVQSCVPVQIGSTVPKTFGLVMVVGADVQKPLFWKSSWRSNAQHIGKEKKGKNKGWSRNENNQRKSQNVNEKKNVKTNAKTDECTKRKPCVLPWFATRWKTFRSVTFHRSDCFHSFPNHLFCDGSRCRFAKRFVCGSFWLDSGKHVFFRCGRGNQNPKVLLLRIGGASSSGHSLTGIPIPDSWTLLTRDSFETQSWKLAGSYDCCLSDTRIASHVWITECCVLLDVFRVSGTFMF